MIYLCMQIRFLIRRQKSAQMLYVQFKKSFEHFALYLPEGMKSSTLRLHSSVPSLSSA